MTTMNDLYPAPGDQHRAHEAYIAAVAGALGDQGYHVRHWDADANDPRDGHIALDVAANHEAYPANPTWSNTGVGLAWNEDRGWFLALDAEPQPNSGSRVVDLGLVRVASPSTVSEAFAMEIGDAPRDVVDGYPDLDFPEHDCQVDDEDVPFELALRHYAGAP